MMRPEPELTWKDAFLKSPGPKNGKEAAMLFLKGLLMGTADIIPGVSGGTIALITGIYHHLIAAITSVNARFIKKMVKGDLKKGISEIHIRFLIPLLLGIATAIITLARVTHHLLKTAPVPTWSFFFGLITASIYVVGNKVDKWTMVRRMGLVAGVGAGIVITGMIPTTTPDTLFYVFLSGVIAICAMILPGISGAFLLLILGKYMFITGALKNPFLGTNLIVIMVFCLGCAFGLAGFSRILNLLLKRHYAATVAVLTGLMAGSLQKIWPWKQVLETRIIRGKEHVIREIATFPDTWNMEVTWALILCLTGFAMVIFMDRMTRHK